MKHLFFFSIFLASLSANAQNTTKKIVRIENNDTTVIIINERMDKMDSVLTEEMKKIYITDSMVTRVDVFIDSSSTQALVLKDGEFPSDSVKVNVGNLKIVIIENKNDQVKGDRKMIIDERVIIEDDGRPAPVNPDQGELSLSLGNEASDNDNVVWSGFGINANGFMNASNKLAKNTELGHLALDPVRSLGIQLNIAEKRFPIINDYLGVVTGVGFQFNRYGLKENVDYASVNDSLIGTINTSVQYTKNTLTSIYLQAPLLLQIATNKMADEAWHLSAGVVGGIRVGAHQKQKWEENGNSNKDKTKDDFQFSPFQASLMASVGYGDWNLYMTYGLTNTFAGAAPTLKAVNAGILFSF
ncbi:MAG: hypothetical protein RLZZ301_1177 [Bacteroidota bacterium]|jgi:hypothetical protein